MRYPQQAIPASDDLVGWRSPSRQVAVAASRPPGTVLRRGDEGGQVSRLQELLNARCIPCPHLEVDGDFGRGTERAVRAFQAARQLPVDGTVGPLTWLELQCAPGELPGTTPLPVPTPAPGSASVPTWMDIARGELDQREIRGARHNPRILEYHASTRLRAASDEIAWCASFVNWVMQQAGLTGTRSAAAASWINWGVSSEPRQGAVLVIHNAAAARSSLTTSGNHVGFLVEQTPTHYVVLGGNQSNRVRVSEFRRSSWTLRGCRWPG